MSLLTESVLCGYCILFTGLLAFCSKLLAERTQEKKQAVDCLEQSLIKFEAILKEKEDLIYKLS